MTVRLASLQDVPGIDRYIRDRESANFYLDYRWGKIAENVFGHKYHVLLSERRDGGIDGLFPFVHFRSVTFGNFLVSMPYYNYGGVCADDDAARGKLIEEAVRMAREWKARHIEFRQEASLNNGFHEKTHKVSMRLPLPGSADELWKSFPSKLRSQVKVPQKGGMTCRTGRFEELDAFYAVFVRNMRDLGTPVYPKAFFRTILEEFPDNSWICSVYKDNVPVASGFLAGSKGRLEIPWASSVRDYNRFSPNMLLYWSCLKFGCEKGFDTFDFGRSTEGESTYRFKEQWGASPSPMIWSYWVPEGGEVPELTPRNPKYRLAIEIWKRLPLGVTRVIGPRIIRNIP
ncbi:MAG: uncharacterized protein H6Q84_1579 [Deltaproteobacteria bacterium]|nr:uncharacterized protein [Deltaproteobacteria bacterium]